MKIHVQLKGKPYQFDTGQMEDSQLQDLRKLLLRDVRQLRKALSKSLRLKRDDPSEKKRRTRLRKVVSIKRAQIRYLQRQLNLFDKRSRRRRSRRHLFARRVETVFMQLAEKELGEARFLDLLESAKEQAKELPAAPPLDIRTAEELAALRARVADLEFGLKTPN